MSLICAPKLHAFPVLSGKPLSGLVVSAKPLALSVVSGKPLTLFVVSGKPLSGASLEAKLSRASSLMRGRIGTVAGKVDKLLCRSTRFAIEVITIAVVVDERITSGKQG